MKNKEDQKKMRSIKERQLESDPKGYTVLKVAKPKQHPGLMGSDKKPNK